MKTNKVGLVTESDLIGQNGHQGYKHEEADRCKANARGRPHLTANTSRASSLNPKENQVCQS